MSFCLPPGEQFLGYPVAGPDNDLRPGHRRYNVVWYRPADETTELRQLLTDERGTTHAISIPPPLIRRAAIAEMRAAAERLLAPQFRADRAADRRADPAADLRSRNAAHGVRPGGHHRRRRFRGAAACRRPAWPRRRTMRRRWWRRCGRATSSRRCGASRRRGCRSDMRIIERARHLGAYLQATQTAEERARSQRHSIPEAVMAETAVLDFLAGVSAADRRRGRDRARRVRVMGRTCRDCQSCQSAGSSAFIPANGAGRAYVAVQVPRMLLAAASEVIE